MSDEVFGSDDRGCPSLQSSETRQGTFDGRAVPAEWNDG